MKQCLFILILLFTLTFKSSSLYPQEWSKPLNITNLGGYSRVPDMVIDHCGVIHVVWSYRIEDWWWKIMYTSSEDDGSTWSEPLDLLQNTDLWMSQPHIESDSNNHLYVTYDYATGTPDKMVYMVVYNGFKWCNPILVSEGMPGSDYNKVLVDHKDRVFVFWGYQETNIKYRIFQNNTFGEIMEPYYNSLGDYYYLYYAAIDTNNKIHWIGYTTEDMPSGTFAHAYFILEPDLDEWSVPQNISIVKAEIGNDIDLSINSCPEVVIREDTAHWPTPNDDITFLLENDGTNWNPPVTISNVTGSQKYQQIAVDQNFDVHVVEQQETVEGYGLVHYKKWNEKWVGQFIDSNYIVRFQKLFFNNNKLYLVYSKTWEVEKEFLADLFFTKYDIVTNIKEETRQTTELKIYPNPGSDNIYIEFENDKQQQIDLSIFDMNGKHLITLISETRPQGMYRQLWNGKDKNGKHVSAGQYLVRLKLGRNTTTGLVEIIK